MNKQNLLLLALFFALIVVCTKDKITGASIPKLQKDEKIRLLFPNGGEIFSIEDTIEIKWIADYDSVQWVCADFSSDSGKTWIENIWGMCVEGSSDSILSYPWPCKDNSGDAVEKSGSNNCLIRIYEFFDPDWAMDTSDYCFSIVNNP